ncbi:MAG: phosphoadenylyl-sulfate reductase [Polyangiaceae bacterium]|nr:phosphoadenylyl-sulfate reductase [Polyangiaceae bacterium]
MKKVIMVKKRLANGEPCKKCGQVEEMLKRRGLWDQIDEVLWADETDPESPGMLLAKKHDVELAPFFLVEEGGETTVVTQAVVLAKKHLAAPQDRSRATRPAKATQPEAPKEPVAGPIGQDSIEAGAIELAGAGPLTIMTWMLERFGARCAIAFSGAEDVALIELAAQTGKQFSVFCLDTGRLHPQTYRFIEKVRQHYGVTVQMMFPQAPAVEDLVRRKGLMSFYDDGHQECCGVRKVEPLRRALNSFDAWITGQRRDQSPTRADVPELVWDTSHRAEGMAKANPLAGWSQQKVWGFIRNNDIPYNELHDQGFISIGCEPCTRAVRPGEHERAGRWWWEEATQRECGLHKG